MTRRQAGYPGEHRPRTDQSWQDQHLVQSGEIDLSSDLRMGEQRLYLRAENKCPVNSSVMQRSDPDVITRQDEAAAPKIVEGEAELSIQVADEPGAHVFVKVDEYLDIARGAKPVPLRNKSLAKRRVIE